MKKKLSYKIFLLALIALITSCTTPYNYTTNGFENAIVIEATITNQLKKQEIKLSRTYKFEDEGPVFENGATISITDDLGTVYGFDEESGIYLSEAEFKASADRTYQLHVKTKDGKSYSSTAEKLTKETNIEDLYKNVTTKEGILGVEIKAKSYDPSNSSKYYRYEYDETYKVVAPKWSPYEAIAVPYSGPNSSLAPGDLVIQMRTKEAKTCYSNKKSDAIILTSTNDLSEDRVDFPVRFIASTDYSIANRYSILVKQFVQNLSAFTFYQTLSKMSGSESLLSQNQPGFLAGNIKSDTDSSEKVIGFFDVSAYSEKRIFFNFSDVFPNEKLPAYPYDCPLALSTPALEKEHIFPYCFEVNGGCGGPVVYSNISLGNSVYFSGYNSLGIVPYPSKIPTPLLIEIYNIQCGDCTSFSSNIKPLFWID
ncbi:hypothetical protein L1276_001968 [Flavobacterium sp. HSC-32F16]|uniref:DUF4249 domain-containing protein n=1 Tax=Flavobacterium sp. HSC-32F16 TaxID=2910964 RepID=UPI0020A5318F|nr:DUF4249 domain-containing protein [Flavobacterium sp. HSC-32F16]MCP2026824.1 hypothetical protein [Flavobacterium sp. HSC-32F16]